MSNDIDLSEILKNCPRGAKFYSYIFGEDTYFMGVSSHQGDAKPIFIYGKYGEGQNFCLTRKGHAYADDYGECCIFPSKDQRDWSKFSAPWLNKGSEKFDPHTSKPFGKVIARKDSEDSRNIDFFSCFKLKEIPICLGGIKCAVISYNDDTEHLVATTEGAPTFYNY